MNMMLMPAGSLEAAGRFVRSCEAARFTHAGIAASPITKLRVSFIFPSMAGCRAKILVSLVRQDNYALRIRPEKPVGQQGD
jgi:hypothetical protein